MSSTAYAARGRAAAGADGGLVLSSCVRLPTAGPVVVEQANGQGTPGRRPLHAPEASAAGRLPAGDRQGLPQRHDGDADPARRGQEVPDPAGAGRLAAPGPHDRLRQRAGQRRAARQDSAARCPRARRARRLGGAGAAQRLHGRAADAAQAPGRWRIAKAPDAFIVPELWYQQHFQDATLYFFDPTGRILVPEPVHLPEAEGDQLPTLLVRALLMGPQPSLSQVARSFIPPGLSTAPGVTVSRQGVAQVTLKGPDPAPLPPKTTELMLAQLAWTLRQAPSVRAFQVTIAGRHITDSSGASTFLVSGYRRYDPTDSTASAQLYALRAGRLVSGPANGPTPVDGPFGTAAVGIGPFAVSLDDTLIAGVTPYRLLMGPIRIGPGVREVYDGAGPLLRPSWDFAGRLWDIERSRRGARVVVVTGGRAHRVQVPGVTGEQVKRFLISRDGSRLVAVVRGQSPTGWSSPGCGTTRRAAPAGVPTSGDCRGRPAAACGSPTSAGPRPRRLRAPPADPPDRRGAPDRRRRLHHPERGLDGHHRPGPPQGTPERPSRAGSGAGHLAGDHADHLAGRRADVLRDPPAQPGRPRPVRPAHRRCPTAGCATSPTRADPLHSHVSGAVAVRHRAGRLVRC